MPELLECEVLRYHNSDRLQKFGLTTLETRRLRGDLIEVFKMFKGFDNITLNDFFKLSSTTLRGHTLIIYKPQVHLDVRKLFFTVRIIECMEQFFFTNIIA